MYYFPHFPWFKLTVELASLQGNKVMWIYACFVLTSTVVRWHFCYLQFLLECYIFCMPQVQAIILYTCIFTFLNLFIDEAWSCTWAFSWKSGKWRPVGSSHFFCHLSKGPLCSFASAWVISLDLISMSFLDLLLHSYAVDQHRANTLLWRWWSSPSKQACWNFQAYISWIGKNFLYERYFTTGEQ